MNYAAAQALADSTLAALRASEHATGRTQPDATTTLDALIYRGPKGRGWQVTVTLRTHLTETGQMGQPTNTVRIVRHVGGETHRDRPDPTLPQLKEQALKALASQPFRQLTLARVRAATSIDDMLFDPAHAQEEAMDALRLQCADHSQKRLDAFAAGLGYDNITTLRSASLSSVPRFKAEGEAGQAAWDAEWSAAQAYIVSVTQGQVAPTFDNYRAALPVTFNPPAY